MITWYEAKKIWFCVNTLSPPDLENISSNSSFAFPHKLQNIFAIKVIFPSFLFERKVSVCLKLCSAFSVVPVSFSLILKWQQKDIIYFQTDRCIIKSLCIFKVWKKLEFEFKLTSIENTLVFSFQALGQLTGYKEHEVFLLTSMFLCGWSFILQIWSIHEDVSCSVGAEVLGWIFPLSILSWTDYWVLRPSQYFVLASDPFGFLVCCGVFATVLLVSVIIFASPLTDLCREKCEPCLWTPQAPSSNAAQFLFSVSNKKLATSLETKQVSRNYTREWIINPFTEGLWGNLFFSPFLFSGGIWSCSFVSITSLLCGQLQEQLLVCRKTAVSQQSVDSCCTFCSPTDRMAVGCSLGHAWTCS